MHFLSDSHIKAPHAITTTPIAGVIKEMGVVADHMNEMQRLCETYWPLIHALSNDPKLHEVK